MRKIIKRTPPIAQVSHSPHSRLFTLNNGVEIEITHEGDQISIRNTNGPLVVHPVVANVVNIRAEPRG